MAPRERRFRSPKTTSITRRKRPAIHNLTGARRLARVDMERGKRAVILPRVPRMAFIFMARCARRREFNIAKTGQLVHLSGDKITIWIENRSRLANE